MPKNYLYQPKDKVPKDNLTRDFTGQIVPAPYYNVALNKDQVKLILDLLAPGCDPDENSVNRQLFDLIERTKNSDVQMYYINIYSVCQEYGGAEEGGWYYHTTDCEMSFGFDNLPRAVDEFNLLVSTEYARDDEDWQCITTEQIIENASYLEAVAYSNSYYSDNIPVLINTHIVGYNTRTIAEYSDLDRHGEGTVVRIERMPAESHDTTRRYYS